MTQYTILCLASYFKGGRFLEECKAQGCYTILLTKEELRDEAWPRHAIDELLLMPTLLKQPDITYAVSYLCRHWRIDRIVMSRRWPNCASICACRGWAVRKRACFAIN